ncbi:MAG: TRAP transporter large permease [Syntrophomonadaceae bacterium]|nr:TRAP transporter large permease [Syntrophomonadaceae bacterium]
MSETMMVLLFIGILLFFFIAGVPVAFSLGLTTLALMLLGVGIGINPELLVLRMFGGVNSFILLAIPFFLFAGRIMNAGGMTVRIFDFAKVIVGPVKGGLGHVNILASMIFAGMSGVAVADAAGLGAIEYKAMKDGGYTDEVSVGITAASATIGPIIPPSVPLVIYAIIANISVGGILLGGLLPGILIGIVLMLMTSFYAHIYNFPHGGKSTWVEKVKAFKSGVLALGTPVILVGGILSGFFTPTEAAAVAVVYALILAMKIYKELNLRELWEIIKQTMIDSAVVLLLVSVASAYAFMVIRSRVPIIFAEQIMAFTQDPLMVLLIINLLLLVVGMFLETIAALSILTPVLLPLVTMVGIDPIHFGLVMVFNLMIGLLTPPFGAVLFVLNKATGVPLARIVKGCLPFYIPLLIGLALITLFPSLTLWLPNLVLGGK